ncbi:MAG: hypothetical protein F6K22_27505 [Okeania sp. SIO2F4]|uniref:hypothetical protein n=1 Tax=Okeania sp. SIO2F4 TaxID=2607790 RepID=UPI00142B00B5|nr:hypothetical protein [Okeania sp. SIO2F4]NES06228.1 hypothetical protein [Okeania sp. SIO2F4]
MTVRFYKNVVIMVQQNGTQEQSSSAWGNQDFDRLQFNPHEYTGDKRCSKEGENQPIGGSGEASPEKSHTASAVVTYEGAMQFIGGICSRLDKQDEKILKYACQHNDRLQRRKQESDEFIAQFKKEQEEIRQEANNFIALLRSHGEQQK